MSEKIVVPDEVVGELLTKGELSESGLITIRDPEVLKKHGWKGTSYPSYVTAAPALWNLWLDLATREK